MAVLLFELTKRDIDFVWSVDCQHAFEALNRTLIDAPMFIQPNFKKPFCLDVHKSLKGVGAILSDKEGNLEKMVDDALLGSLINSNVSLTPGH